jgi:polyphosphate glucokinase
LFVVGGGVSRRADKFLSMLEIETPIVPARFQNDSGIAGAAYLASEAEAARTL